MNVNNNAIKRIMADVRELAKHPSPRYSAAPLEDNIFEWHFSIRGPSGTDFEGGTYHGRILLPSEYPFKPPNIIFLTKTGRFEVGTKICLSISAYHEESWQPAWGVRTMLEAIISFLPSEGAGSIGSLEYSKSERQKLAKESLTYSCPCCGPIAALLSEIDDKEEVDKEVAGQISQLHIAGSSYPGKTPVPAGKAAPAPASSSSTAVSAVGADSALDGKEGKESGDITGAATVSGSVGASVGASVSVSGTADVVQKTSHTAVTSSPIPTNTTPTDGAKVESINAGVTGAPLLTGFTSADIDDFVQRRLAEAASNDEEEKSATIISHHADLLPVAADKSDSVVGASGVSASVSSAIKSCPTCGIDKHNVVPVVSRGAEVMRAPSLDANNTAASSSQSHDVAASSVSVGSDQDINIDAKKSSTASLEGSQGTENFPVASTSPTATTISQSPPDVTDAILSASLYVIGALICAIVIRRLFLLFLLARGHIPDSDGGDL